MTSEIIKHFERLVQNIIYINIKIKILRIVSTAFSIAWLLFIFSNSMKTADNSLMQSGKMMDLIKSIFSFIGFNNIDFINEFLVRKAAHFTEFFILGALFSLTFSSFHKIKFKGAVIISASGLLCAVCDELIQLSYNGRAGRATDVLIDFSGIIISVAFSALLINFYKNKKTFRED